MNQPADSLLPSDLYLAAQVRELDRRAIEDYDIDGYALMQRAAGAAFEIMLKRWPEVSNLWVLCGTGNNGGDALVLARLAIQEGLKPQVMLLAEPQALTGSAAQALADFQAAGGELLPFNESQAARLEEQADVVVDGLFGTGLSRPVDGDYRIAIETMRMAYANGAGVLALDIPSGLNADTGAVMGCAVAADCTVTFIGLKLGLLTAEGPEHCGDIQFKDLEVPPQVYADLEPAAQRIDEEFRLIGIAPRTRTAHKGHHGHVLCIGGDYATAGAIRIAAEGSLRAGAGLVSVATRPKVAIAMSQARPEVMAQGLESADALSSLWERASVLLIGPGLGQGPWSQGLWAEALKTDLPMLVDADALNLLAQSPQRRANWILTPHPGEAARLLDCSSTEIQADRPAAAKKLAERYGGVVVLKGAGTLIAAETGQLYLCSAGNPGMAVGGMGDLLAGIIAGLAAQGSSLISAAALGVEVHARAADSLAARQGERGLLPTDLLDELPRWLNV